MIRCGGKRILNRVVCFFFEMDENDTYKKRKHMYPRKVIWEVSNMMWWVDGRPSFLDVTYKT